MDVYKFINSKAIRDYMKETKYEFTPVQIAWLIDMSEYTTYSEKREALLEIVNTLPNCDFQVDCCILGQKNYKLHETILKYINIYDKYIEDFYKESEDFYYKIRYLYEGDDDWSNISNKQFYKSIDECICSLNDEFESEYSPTFGKSNIKLYEISKFSISNASILYTVSYFSNDQIHRIDVNKYNEDEEYEIIRIFESMFMRFPVPFKYGDIVMEKQLYDATRSDPFVLKYVNNSDKSYGDSSDMLSVGYWARNDGTIYLEHTDFSTYMNLEYFSGDFKECEKFLPILSKYLKQDNSIISRKNIDIAFLLALYKRVFLDNQIYNDMEIDYFCGCEENLKENFGITLDVDELNSENTKE